MFSSWGRIQKSAGRNPTCAAENRCVPSLSHSEDGTGWTGAPGELRCRSCRNVTCAARQCCLSPAEPGPGPERPGRAARQVQHYGQRRAEQGVMMRDGGQTISLMGNRMGNGLEMISNPHLTFGYVGALHSKSARVCCAWGMHRNNAALRGSTARQRSHVCGVSFCVTGARKRTRGNQGSAISPLSAFWSPVPSMSSSNKVRATSYTLCSGYMHMQCSA